jgi:hypothetical protein
MLPHFGVHGRHENHRPPRHQQCIGQQVVGQARGGTGEYVRCGRSHHHQVSVLPQPHMVHGVHRVKNGGRHRLAGECFPGGASDELLGGLRRNHGDLVAGFLKQPEQGCGLVGGDPAAYT